MSKIVTYIELDTPAFPITSPMGPDVTWRFAEPTEYLDRSIDCIPSVAGVSYDAAVISLGENLGQRASLTITFRDHKHVLDGESFDSGTFFGKWRARFGQKLRGRTVRLIRGFAGQAIDDMETRHFFVENTDGPTPDGVYTIVAKDLLKFADDDRSQAPVLSNGRLVGSIDDNDLAAVLTPTGIGNAEYPAAGHICLGGKEIVSFTRSGDNLTIVRGQLGTPAESHSAGDRAQLVLHYDGDDVADIISDLLTGYAAVDSDYIPLSEWQQETADNLGGIIYARAITEPTSVSKLLSELVEQAALALWWDERAQMLRLQVLKEIATDAAVWDEEVILEGSLKVKDQPSKRISQIWTYYSQRNPADRGDNEDNYRTALADVDLEREGDYGGPIVRKIIGKWVATENAAQRLNQVQLSRFRDPPRKFTFDLFHGSQVSAGGGYRLSWRQNQDVTGAVVEEGAPIQITRVSTEPGVVHIEAEEMLASGTVVITNVVILTTTGSLLSWTVPADWNDSDNRIECIGAGGGGFGDPSLAGKGGGGGAYSAIENLNLTPAASVSYRVGSKGLGGHKPGNASADGTDGTDTWFNGATLGASSVGAKGGQGGVSSSAAGQGGQAASGIGATKFSGGNGGNAGFFAGGGGGAAAGPNGNGGRGGNTGFITAGGAGGGGANGGGNGVAGSGETGGRGGHNRFGFGGGVADSPNGSDGGGGKGNDLNVGLGGTGSSAQLWTQTIAPIFSAGPAGGPGAGGRYNWGQDAVNYGAGGSGGGSGAADLTQGGNGSQGVIVITWRPVI